MLDNKKILDKLDENGLQDIEQIEYNEGALIRFFYDFDKEEKAAAKAYSNDECDDEEGSQEWYENAFFPYLNELAIDNMGEIIDEIMEENNIDAQYVSYEADMENPEYCEFIAVFYEKGKDIDIDSIMEELEL